MKHNLLSITTSLLFSMFFIFSFHTIAQNKALEKYFSERAKTAPLLQTVQLYPSGYSYLPPIVSLGASQGLRLSFDVMGDDNLYFMAKLQHCTYDWKESNIAAIEYLSSYNEFRINDYESSFSTKVPYWHYVFEIPDVKLSGNYKVLLFLEGKPDQIVFEGRFIVYEPLVKVDARFERPFGYTSNTHQQVNFFVDYSEVSSQFPNQDFIVAVRQNNRWDNARYFTKPTMFDLNNNKLTFNSQTGENMFEGGNEFRMFDTQGTMASGLQVRQTDMAGPIGKVWLYQDEPLSNRVYDLSVQDKNGRFRVGRTGSDDPELESDYVLVTHTLKVSSPYTQPLYVVGASTLWSTSSFYEMGYDEPNSQYSITLPYKIGTYNYTYWGGGFKPSEKHAVDGSYYQTRNDYDFIVYFRPRGSRYDRVVGYKQTECRL